MALILVHRALPMVRCVVRTSSTRRFASRNPEQRTQPIRQEGVMGVPTATEAQTALARLEAIDSALSASVRLPGTPLRFGLDTALGRIPFAGVIAHSAAGAYTLATAWRFGASPLLLGHLALNLVIDSAVRAVPLVGPWLAPSFASGAARSVALLRAHVAKAAAHPPVVAAGGGEATAGRVTLKEPTNKQGGPLCTVVWLLRVLTWPLRHVPLAVLLGVVVLLPLAVWLGAVGFTIFTVLRLMGLV